MYWPFYQVLIQIHELYHFVLLLFIAAMAVITEVLKHLAVRHTSHRYLSNVEEQARHARLPAMPEDKRKKASGNARRQKEKKGLWQCQRAKKNKRDEQKKSELQSALKSAQQSMLQSVLQSVLQSLAVSVASYLIMS